MFSCRHKRHVNAELQDVFLSSIDGHREGLNIISDYDRSSVSNNTKNVLLCITTVILGQGELLFCALRFQKTQLFVNNNTGVGTYIDAIISLLR